MDWFHAVPCWHPRFRAVARPAALSASGPGLGPGTILVEEAGAFLLPFAESAILAQLVGDALTPADWCAAGGDMLHLPGLLSAMEALARRGDLVARGATPGGWAVPRVDAVPVREEGDAGSVTWLAEPGGLPAWSAAVDAAGGGAMAGVDLVLCDDYFDPRLAGEWDRALQAGRSRWWMPVRLGGAQSIAGPLLRPGGPGPCWHCFLHRLRRNSPGRTWLEREVPGSHGLVPLFSDPAGRAPRWRQAQEAVRRLLADAGPGRFAVLGGSGTPGGGNDDTGPWQAVPRRPQCPQCGDAGWMARQARQPVQLRDVHALPGARGGSRTVPPETTVQAVQPSVGAWAGVVTECSPLPLPEAGAITVYRSAFHPAGPQEGGPVAARWCLGKGMTAAQAQASALCEAVERYAAGFQGDEAWTEAREDALPAPAFGPRALIFVSERQRARGGPGDDRVLRTHVHPSGAPLAWTPAWSLTREAPCFLPLAHCYAGVPEHWSRYGEWNSNGCAAGNGVEEAVLQGLLEVVERDATAIWWYNELAMPALDLGRADPDHLRRVRSTLGSGWSFWALDLTHDLGIPVVAAVGRRADGDWALGFGCSLDADMACERALTELVQLVAVGKTLPAQWNGLRRASPQFLLPEGGDNRAIASFVRARAATDGRGGIRADIAACVEAARRCGLEVVVHDYSRPDLPLRTVKTTLPGACHIWPELANPRLSRVPVAMGWRDAARDEGDLNPWPLYV
ncbi:TOMM precursor leader peptide-binding protein [Acidovorax sacchari]|uniref:TOMM precursor leader peptide-binding protein n=1 Tax=Acidovorax sacchari TaxID=3230736 RepID=UPI0039E48746